MTQTRNRNSSAESRNSFQWRIHLCSALNSRRLSRFLNVACLCFFVTPPQCFHFSVSHKKLTIFSLFLFLLLCHPVTMFSLFHSPSAVFSVSHKKVTVFSLFHNQATVFSLSCERLTNWTGTSDTSVSTLLIGLVKENSGVRVKWIEFEFWEFDWTPSAKALFRQQKWAIFLVST